MQEASDVVKGTAKRIIVVKSPDKRVFEEAIFIVREDYLRTGGISQSKLIEQARQAADGYVNGLRKTPKLSTGLLILLSSLGGTGISFAVLKLFGL